MKTLICFFRSTRRPNVNPEPRSNSVAAPTTEQVVQAAPSGSHQDTPESSNTLRNVASSLANSSNEDYAPSSPESFSDSVSSSSSSAPEDSPLRTIVIRANINTPANAGQNNNEPRIQVVFGGGVPHAR